MWAQIGVETPEERVVRLTRNVQLLKVEMTMDRAVFFPGETATITVTVTNPTGRPLEVPLVTDTEGFYGSVKLNSGWTPPAEPLRPPDAAAPGTLLPPGGGVTFTIHTLDKIYRPWQMTGAMPPNPGRHRLVSRLGGAVEFEVAEPILEKGMLVPLHKTETYQPEAAGEEPSTEQLAAFLVAAQMGDEHVVMVSMDDLPMHNKIRTNPDGTLAGRTAHLGTPWIRAAAGASRITDLTATVDALDVITIEYTTADGVRHRVPLDASRHPLL
jgi:hypothetical protein